MTFLLQLIKIKLKNVFLNTYKWRYREKYLIRYVYQQALRFWMQFHESLLRIKFASKYTCNPLTDMP